MKSRVRRIFVQLGLAHPAKGMKVSQSRKAEVLLSYKKPEMTTFVETGTRTGEMIELMLPYFEEIHSIELDSSLYQKALRKFRENRNVHLHQGDSAEKICSVLRTLSTPTLFWLDAHPPGEITFENSPIQSELEAIFAHQVRGHTVIIDDARHFSLSCIRRIRRLASAHRYHTSLEEGLFRLTPEA